MRLAGRRILVSGAAAGIGAAIAGRFQQEGADLLLLDREPARLAALARDLEEAGAHLSAQVADITDPAAVASALAKGIAVLGGLDGVVNSAGIDLETGFEAMSLDAWQRVIAVNLTGPMIVCQAALPHLCAAGGGSIVNIASGAGLRPVANRSAYCSAKSGLIMLTKTLALDYGAKNIRANALCPGAVETELFNSSLANSPDPEAAREAVRARYALHRIANPEEIAEAALFLTATEASFVTGTALAVDGGRVFH